VELLEHMAAVYERMLVEDHLDRLALEYKLTSVYLDDSQLDRVIALLKYIVIVEVRMLYGRRRVSVIGWYSS